MRVALVVAHGIPNPSAGGASLTNWTIASYLLERGHEVIVMPIVGEHHWDPAGVSREDRVAQLEAIGARVEPIQSCSAREELDAALIARIGRLVRPQPELVYPNLLDREQVAGAIERIAPDVVFAYHWEALAALYGLRGVPKLGVAVDLSHLPRYYRWRATLRHRRAGVVPEVVRLASVLSLQRRLMVEFMNDCAAAGDFAAHHADWLRARGAVRCEYLRTPVPDPVGPAWRARREASAHSGPPRVLLIGHLGGIATMEGLDLFAEGVLPRLERALGPTGFEVRVAGGYAPPPELARALDRPAVTFCGHLDDPSEEFLSADVVVVPTTIPLGARVRILSAFSYGCPVVAHESNALGIPELSHQENALLGRREADLADGIVLALRDADFRRRLEDAGRATFERWFAPPVAAARICEILDRIATPPAPRARPEVPCL